ncbi:hypothetical protein [Candidatus Nitrospira allomarina]|uniref:Uncharacterized protein n=1 Tax=Candidatus Nitrospira allomarina TaxID=3020900 RepID=A0AA96JYA8_9BACT|nr:hypothetical protein [Candidatus Nitrospira allomarina]WNM57329.1 hypothetical protein PP769_15320 [Candidatus Nitrospira allomarina]
MKTVFILGAGFSLDAGAPTQASLMAEAFRLYREDRSLFDPERFEDFKKFLLNQLNVSEGNLSKVALEDIFTPLDRCLSENSQFRGIGLGQIMKVRESVFYVVGQTIHLILERTGKSKNYIDLFADYLTKESSVRSGYKYKRADPVSVISTNWDILLDTSIYRSIRDDSHDGVVDYCCYISSLDKSDESIKPGLEKLGQGGFNVKLLKLHGSLNWLQCPRCMRLYARFSGKEAMYNFINPMPCRHCDTNFPEEQGNHLLVSNLIMPTFIKDLSNPQYKIIWQNAGIEISEATRIVFIGYSLPSADFEMRQLLSRMMRKNTNIEVVDYCKSDDTEKKESLKNHWGNFFGDRNVKFHFDGASQYIEDLVGSESE